MKAVDKHGKLADAETRVRHNVGWAGLTAGLLIFFGFFGIAGAVGPPLFLHAHSVFHGALRMGGVGMVLVAIWCSLGHPLALLFDALLSFLIGVILVVTGALMWIDGGNPVQNLIIITGGVLFISAGRRKGRDYLRFPPAVREENDGAADVHASTPWDGTSNGVPTETSSSASGEVLKGSRRSTDFQPKPKTSALRVRGGRFDARDEAIRLPDSEPPVSPGEFQRNTEADGIDHIGDSGHTC